MRVSEENKEALIKALDYWIDHWDFECPTLFGLERSDLQKVALDLTEGLNNNKEIVLLACLSSLAELLYGASAVPKTKLHDLLGIDFYSASSLCKEIKKECDRIDAL